MWLHLTGVPCIHSRFQGEKHPCLVAAILLREVRKLLELVMAVYPHWKWGTHFCIHFTTQSSSLGPAWLQKGREL